MSDDKNTTENVQADVSNSIEEALIESVQEQAAEAAAQADVIEEAAAEAGFVDEEDAEAALGGQEPAGAADAETSAANAESVMDATAETPAETSTESTAGATLESTAETTAEGADEDDNSDYRRRLREYTKELKKLPGQWFIIQCYSGYENKVKTNLDMRAQTLEVEDSIFDVVVPVEQVLETKDGKKKLVKRKLLPGYVLVRMDLNDAAWSVVRDTPGVTSFVGNEGNATPVKHRDVAKFLMPKETVSGAPAVADAEGEQVIALPEQSEQKKYAHDYQVGEAVTILSGPLASVSATISEIDPETGKMQGLVSIFGRETPVELSPNDIERIS